MGGHTKKRRTRLTRAEKEAASRALDAQRDDMRTSTDLGGGSRWRDPQREAEGRWPAKRSHNRDRAVPIDTLMGLSSIGRVSIGKK